MIIQENHAATRVTPIITYLILFSNITLRSLAVVPNSRQEECRNESMGRLIKESHTKAITLLRALIRPCAHRFYPCYTIVELVMALQVAQECSSVAGASVLIMAP